ncbi:PAS domain-containing protein [Pontibacter sp. JH31]|uniref:histidine kinase n=1 Tax=Pontibacter aquaedesilientis TaxID=2766980 RepID=A0ABR7XCX7_9BACT|nr:PAS domain-containing protein [Pontibacter aquaedesilientis]MBD1395746.1 PAS domain-containing protein [Pontibacter aquaedesilientis]
MTKIAALPTELLHFIEAVPDLYLLLAPDFTILSASKPYLAATHRTLDEIKDRYLFDVFPENPALSAPDGIKNLQYSLNWVLQHKKPHQMALQRYDVQLPLGSGEFKEKYWLPTNTPIMDEAQNIQYILHKVVDVSEQVLTQEKLEQSEHLVEVLSGEQKITKAQLVSARAEAELERQKLYNTFMQAPALICLFEGPQHVFKFVNPLYQELVGDRPLLGKPIIEAMPELKGQGIVHLLNQVYETGESVYAVEMKVQLDHANTGHLGENYYNFTYQPVRNLQGIIEGIMVFAYQVTAQVEARLELMQANAELSAAQEELKKLNMELEARIALRTQELERSKALTELQHKRLQTLFVDAPIPFLLLDGPKHVFQLVNPAFQKIFPGRKMLGKPLLDALPELKDSAIPGILDQVYETGKLYEGNEFPLMLARHEGDEPEEILFTFTYMARQNEHGKVDGVMVYAQDVTEQVRARQKVEQSAEQLRLITDALPVLIGYLDKEEKYRFANKAYESWFPIKSADLLGRSVREVVGESAYEGVKQYIDRALAGERLDFESEMPYRKDFVKYIRTSYVPDIRDGQVAGFYTLVSDITDQVEAFHRVEASGQEAKALSRKLAATNLQLSAANEQLIRTNVDLDNFIYTASHDLKAPIFNIERLVQILLESMPPELLKSEELTQVVSMIEDSIRRFKRTIDHLTEVIKLQKENSPEATLIDLAEVINDVRLDLSSQMDVAGAELDIDIVACPYLHFSHKNLRSVIYNLLSNAIKYSSPDRKPKIRITCHPKGSFYLLMVQDNGLGMNLSGSQKLFTMFSRMHNHVEGSGIGLYMVKKIVENAGGHIEVESQLGVGSTFRVYLKK